MARAGSKPRATRGGRSASDVERYVSRGSNRAFVVIALFLLLAAVFLARLIYLQVIVADDYSARAEASRTQYLPIEPRRGTIYDRNGNILAISVDAITIYANPKQVETPGSTARVIAEILGGKPGDYMDALAAVDSTYQIIWRKCDVAKAEKLKAEKLPGIYFVDDTRREYPYGQVGGQVIGGVTMGVDEELNSEYYVGDSGLELYYNQILSGTAGYYEAEVGADGTPIPGGVHVAKNAIEGQDIVVSLDIDFQAQLEKDLVAGLEGIGAETGAAVVMDATTGEIYAAASLPLYNPADRSEVKQGAQQLKAVSNLFEPGSVFKSISALAILETDTMTPDDEIFCPSEIEADGYIVSDAYVRDDVTWSLRTIINRSSNVGISLSVEKMGFDKLYEAIQRYNFDKLTGVDYPGEQLGYLLDFDYWSRVVGYNVSFGQGISVNALQIVRFYGAIINDGVEVTPHFLVRKPQTNEVATYETTRITDDTDSINTLRSMLRTVVTEGTGTKADIEGFDVAGKTSTAEIYDEINGGYRAGVYNLAFTGFIDNSSSKLVCFVGADEVPGDRTVTQIFQDIMSDAVTRYNITSN